MNREILFRGQKIDTKEWVEGSLLQSTNNKSVIVVKNKNIINKQGMAWYLNAPSFEVIPESVGQFTGLPDKNGVKIFEGDIVSCKKENWKIVFSSKWGFIATDSKELSHVMPWYDDVEIIGAIYDNPELLTN